MKKIIAVSGFIIITSLSLLATTEGVKTDNVSAMQSNIDARIKKNFDYMDELIASMNKSIKSIDENKAKIKDMEENKAAYVTCFMLDSLKGELEDFKVKLQESPSEKRAKALEKIQAIYDREKTSKNCKGH